MVKIAKYLTGVTMVALLFFLYVQIGAQLRVTLTDVTVVPASERRDTFDTLIAAVMHGDVDTAYTQNVSTDPAGYSFVAYTANVRNIGIPAAEWVQLGVARMDDDVALIPGDAIDAGAFSGGTVSAVLLTTNEAAQESRAVWAEYYVLGRRMSAAASAAK